jgi:SAM-dependent methyltransferase
MLAVARALPPVAGASVDWREASVLALPFGDGEFDVVLCQLGLQFFPDRPTALREIRRVLGDGGRVALNVFGPIEHNRATHALSQALDRHVRPGASLAKRNEHALADTGTLHELMTEARFRDLLIATQTKVVHFRSVADRSRPVCGDSSRDGRRAAPRTRPGTDDRCGDRRRHRIARALHQ